MFAWGLVVAVIALGAVAVMQHVQLVVLRDELRKTRAVAERGGAGPLVGRHAIAPNSMRRTLRGARV